MNKPTYAYVGYDTHGTPEPPMLLAVDDGSRDTAHEAHQVLASGGRIKRMTIDEARAVKLYERPAPAGGG